MKARWWVVGISLALLALAPAAGASGIGVEIWTSRGNDAVYQPGEHLDLQTRVSADAYLLVYEIDSEGSIYLLYPFRNDAGLVQTGQTYSVPPEHSNVDLVVDGPVGQCYLVAIASKAPFNPLPWYLRPYDMQAEQVGYDGPQAQEEGITADGKIVGDPFVAMERIRRRVVAENQDPDAFGTSYVSYYVHNEVSYPRYLCYDCHRPDQWAWWTDFDPYYTHCSVIDFHVNWGWAWGPTYWFGYVPYYTYFVRPDCPPHYATWYGPGYRYSSWNGWACWNNLWGSHLVRYKSAPPKGYIPPSKFPDQRYRVAGGASPPGFIVRDPAGRRSGNMVAGNLTRNGARTSPGMFGTGDRGQRTSPGMFGTGERSPRTSGMFGTDDLNRTRQTPAWGRNGPSAETGGDPGAREGRSAEEGPQGNRGDRVVWGGSQRDGGMGWASRPDAPARGTGTQRLEWPGARRQSPYRASTSPQQPIERPNAHGDRPRGEQQRFGRTGDSRPQTTPWGGQSQQPFSLPSGPSYGRPGAPGGFSSPGRATMGGGGHAGR